MKFAAPDAPGRFHRRSHLRRRITKNWKSTFYTCRSRLQQLFVDNNQNQLFLKNLNEVKVQRPGVVNYIVGIQKCIVEWKVENLESLKLFCQDPVVQWNDESSQISIHSNPFTLGKEIGCESTWTLCLRSHHECNELYYFSINLRLLKILQRYKTNHMKVSCVLHLLDSDGSSILTRELQNVVFKPECNNNSSHGIPEFLPFSFLNENRNLLEANCFRIRLELYIPGRPKRVQLMLPKQIIHDKSLQINENISIGPGISCCKGGKVEVLASEHSFYVDSTKLERYPKLKSLLREDERCGNLGIICLPDYSDKAVCALLTYIVGDYNDFVTKIEDAVDILILAYEFSLPVLAYDMWLNVVFLLRLENIPWITVLAHKYQAPEFVLNYVYIQLLSFMAELQHVKEFHSWVVKEPLAFVCMFTTNNKDTVEYLNIQDPDEEVFKREFYLHEQSERHDYPVNDPIENPTHIVDKNFLLDDSFDEAPHNDKCQCNTCRKTQVYCNERLYIGYLARIKLMDENL